MSRRFLLRTAAYTLGFYLMLMILRGFTFTISHLPPTHLHLDQLIIALTYLEQAMLFPRWLLRQLWFSESTPALLNWILAIVNNLAWGLSYAAFKTWRNPSAPQPPVMSS